MTSNEKRDRDLDRDNNLNDAPDANRDPITGAPGSHPIGTGVGAAGGGAAGAAIGAAIGATATGPAAPVGAVVGAVVGAIAGGLAGKGAAEAVNPTAEDAYWRENFKNRPYASTNPDYPYEDYQPAYQHGWENYDRYSGRTFEEAESDLSRDWDTRRGESRLDWDSARHAARDAWDRVGTSRSTTEASSMNTGTVGAPQAYPGNDYESTRSTAAGSTSDLGGYDVDTFTSDARNRYSGRDFDDVENDLHRDWDSRSNRSGESTWEKVKDNVRRGWHKVERAMPGDADRDRH